MAPMSSCLFVLGTDDIAMQQYWVLFHNSRGVNGFTHPQKSEITHRGAKTLPRRLTFLTEENMFLVFSLQDSAVRSISSVGGKEKKEM